MLAAVSHTRGSPFKRSGAASKGSSLRRGERDKRSENASFRANGLAAASIRKISPDDTGRVVCCFCGSMDERTSKKEKPHPKRHGSGKATLPSRCLTGS